MIEDVVISMRSIQGCDEEQPNTMEFSTDGYYCFDGEVGCLTYMETEVTGLQGTRTSMFVMPDCVVVDREGMINSRMVFKEGEKNSFVYDTPYGMATMGIRTGKIKKAVNDKGGSVEIDYVVDMAHALVSQNKFHITIKSRSDENKLGQ